MKGFVLDTLPTGEPIMDFMPPLDFRLAELPAKIDYSAFQHARKITQTTIHLFYQDTQFLNGLEMLVDLLKRVDIMWSGGTPTPEGGVGASLPDLLFGSDKQCLAVLDRRQMVFEFRQDLVGFSEREQPF